MNQYRYKLNFLLLLLISSNSYAENINSNMQSKAVINGTCKMSITSADFGVIPVGVSYSTTNLRILCSNKLSYSVAMNYPLNGQGNFGGIYTTGILLATNPSNTDWINYKVILPNGTDWGSQEGTYDGSYGTVAGSSIGVLKSIGTGEEQVFPVKVYINTKTYQTPSGYIQNDTYTDTMTAVVNF